MKHYKILCDTRSDSNELTSYCMDGFGRGYSLSEANVLKAHLESKGYMNVKIVDIHSAEVMI